MAHHLQRLWYGQTQTARAGVRGTVLVFEGALSDLPMHFLKEVCSMKLLDLLLCRVSGDQWVTHTLKIRPERPGGQDVQVTRVVSGASSQESGGASSQESGGASQPQLTLLPWCVDILEFEIHTGVPLAPPAYAEVLERLQSSVHGCFSVRSFVSATDRLWRGLAPEEAEVAMRAMALQALDFGPTTFSIETRILPHKSRTCMVSTNHTPEEMQHWVNRMATVLLRAVDCSLADGQRAADLTSDLTSDLTCVSARKVARACAWFLAQVSDVQRLLPGPLRAAIELFSSTRSGDQGCTSAGPGSSGSSGSSGSLGSSGSSGSSGLENLGLLTRRTLLFTQGWAHVPSEVLLRNAALLGEIEGASTTRVARMPADYGADRAKTCDGCGRSTLFPKRCAKCHTGCFCSKECQELAWPQHRRTPSHRAQKKLQK